MYTDHQGTDNQCALMISVWPQKCHLSVSISASCQCHISVPTSAHQCHISVPI
ncbi:unnamed protein product [Staurois parvus]|uniref:Uncharacterized protein n=1 Tax=Staurois parvus TaxID=386267 RepID=A0ABN9H2U1_9NEOB|nr:unnamed protein product [Staurois parvus]